MRQNIISFIVGIIFALGLGVSGMTHPQKVINFLDFWGNWDPSLLFVMAAAVGLHMVTYHLIKKRKSPIFSEQWFVPIRKDISISLIAGSTLFGIGWGLGGYCPGPAVTALASLQWSPIVFVLSMMAGMLLFRFTRSKFSKLS